MITVLAPCVFIFFISWWRHLYLALIHSVIPQVKGKVDVRCLVSDNAEESPLKERNPLRRTSFFHLFLFFVWNQPRGCSGISVPPTQNPLPCPASPGTLPTTTSSHLSASPSCDFSGRGRYWKERKKVILTRDKNNYHSNLITLHAILIIDRDGVHLRRSWRSQRGIECGVGLLRTGSVRPAPWFPLKSRKIVRCRGFTRKNNFHWASAQGPWSGKCVSEGILLVMAAEVESLNPGPARPE